MFIAFLLTCLICVSSVYAQENYSNLQYQSSTPRSIAYGEAGVAKQGAANSVVKNAALSVDGRYKHYQFNGTSAWMGENYSQHATLFQFPLYEKAMAIGILRQKYDEKNTYGENSQSLDESQYSLNMAYSFKSNLQMGFTLHSGSATKNSTRTMWATNAQEQDLAYENKNDYLSIDVGLLYHTTLFPDRLVMYAGYAMNDLYHRNKESNTNTIDAVYASDPDDYTIHHSFLREMSIGVSLQGNLGIWVSGDISLDFYFDGPLENEKGFKGTGDSRYSEEESEGRTIQMRSGIGATVLSVFECTAGFNSLGWGITLDSDKLYTLYTRITNNQFTLAPISDKETFSKWSVSLRYFNATKTEETEPVAMDDDGDKYTIKIDTYIITGQQLDLSIGYIF